MMCRKKKLQVIGMGYNSHIFKNESLRVNDGVTRIAFAGKISVKKGVESLIRSLDYLEYDEKEGLKIGALTTLRTIETSPLVKERTRLWPCRQGSGFHTDQGKGHHGGKYLQCFPLL